jgi:hypothetical protein
MMKEIAQAAPKHGRESSGFGVIGIGNGGAIG